MSEVQGLLKISPTVVSVLVSSPLTGCPPFLVVSLPFVLCRLHFACTLELQRLAHNALCCLTCVHPPRLSALHGFPRALMIRMLIHSWCRMFRFAILNDFEAVGYGIPAVAETDIVVLNDAPIVPNVCPSSASLCHCSALVPLWSI